MAPRVWTSKGSIMVGLAGKSWDQFYWTLLVSAAPSRISLDFSHPLSYVSEVSLVGML